MAEGGAWWEEAGAEGFNFEAEAGVEDNTADYVTDGCAYLGQSVLRVFGRGVESYGTVVSWLPGHLNDGEAYYRVKHDDGDEEDLDDPELEAALAAARNKPRAGAATPAPSRDAAAAVEALSDGGAAPEMPEAFKAPADPATTYLAACWRGVKFVADLAASDANVGNFGADALSALHDVAATAPEPVRALALHHVEKLAQAWKHARPELDPQMEPPEVADAIQGIEALERVGVGHSQLKLEIKEYASKITEKRGDRAATRDFLGADVQRSNVADADPDRRAARCRAATSAIAAAAAADRAGVEVGASEEDVSRWLGGLRPYAAWDQLGWEPWLDQATLACAVVLTASRGGELRLRPAALPDEFRLLAPDATVARCVRRGDVHLTGDVVRCLRVFGVAGDDPRIAKGCDFLVASQTSEGVDAGGWPTRDGDVTSYAAFHAAACAAGALYEPNFRGFGPAVAALAPRDGFAACGARLGGAEEVTELVRSYKAQAETGEERRTLASLSLVERATRRLCGLLKWQTAMNARSIDDYDRAPRRMKVRRMR